MARKSGKLETVQDVLKETDITIDSIERNEAFIRELVKNARAVPDYRHPSYVRHLLEDILVISLLAVLADCDEWEEIADFARQKEKWLRRYLELPNGIPSSDTFRVVVSGINPVHFYQVIMGVLENIIDDIYCTVSGEKAERDILSMDGKESRGSRRSRDGNALHTLNLYSADYGICIGQEFIEEKSNEIPAGPKLLERMDIKDCVVTWDALNTQKDTVEAVIKGGGEYVAALKGNHPLFWQELREFFGEEELERLKREPGSYLKTTEKEHGGIAVREYYQTEDVEWYAEKDKWKNLKSFGTVRKRLLTDEGEKEETRYYISSLPAGIELFEKAVRQHWGVENKLHWHLDFTFRDDRNRTAEKTGAKNMQILKKTALGILKLVQGMYGQSLKRIRKTIARDCENELEKILSSISADAVKAAIEAGNH